MIGSKLAHYEIVSAIGKGGMGEVWRAKDTKLGREVAIKTLPEEFAKDADRLARFEREAKLLASLNHPNIAAIYGLEEHQGTRFLVLELVEGPTLEDRIKQGAIPVEESLKLALQIAEALEAAHESGVIHRDLKPANIKVTPDGKVKVLDFGLAKAFCGEEAEANLSQSPTLSMAATQQGIILGTAAYMSPEQARGENADQRADVWAFGVVLFEMLTGRGTFEGRTVSDVLAAVLAKDPKWDSLPLNLHPRLRQLLERCLSKEVRGRYAGVSDARTDIEDVLADPSGVLVQPVTAIQSRPQSKLPWVAPVALGLVIAGVAGWNLRPAPEPEPDLVTRFSQVLPEEQPFTTSGRPVVAISPDGSRMVYAANNQLYLRTMVALEASPIPGTDEIPAAPFFSPDGQWVGYFAVPDGQFKKIAISGGAPVTLCDGTPPYGRPSWGDDDIIVFGQPEGIMKVSANGGTPELLVAASAGNLGAPQILPDGESLLFHEGSPFEGEIMVQSLESGERKVLFPGVAPKYLSTGHLVYGIGDVLFAVPFDLDSLQVTGGPVPMVEGVRQGPMHYALSASGSLVYVQGSAGATENRTLALVDFNGLVEPLSVPPKEYLTPRLSPDGQRLAVESIEGDGSVIWVHDLSGQTAIQQLTFEGDNQRPIWTPDGQQITFSSDRDGTMSLYTMEADGSGVAERLTTAEDGREHWPGSWSPDGQTLFFLERGQGNTDSYIWTLSRESGETQGLYDTPEPFYEGPELSPDGKWLAYNAGPASTMDIYVEPFPPTGSRRRISQNGGYWPLWSPDGDALFYRALEQSGERTIKSVNIVTEPTFGFSDERTLPVEGFIVVRYHRDHDITTDGERFLMVFPADQADSEPARPQINIVTNWFEELKERVPVP